MYLDSGYYFGGKKIASGLALRAYDVASKHDFIPRTDFELKLKG